MHLKTPEPLYPIQQILRTVEGEGPFQGEVIILVRFAFSEDVKYIHLKSDPELLGHKLPYAMVPLSTVVEQCCRLAGDPRSTNKVHIGGEDPCMTRLDPLINALHVQEFNLHIDTFGLNAINASTTKDYISVSPRPNLPVSNATIARADELRFYISADPTVQALWDDARQNVQGFIMAGCKPSVRLTIIPRTTSAADVQATLAFALKNSKFKVSLPYYRMFPAIDEVAGVEIWTPNL